MDKIFKKQMTKVENSNFKLTRKWGRLHFDNIKKSSSAVMSGLINNKLAADLRLLKSFISHNP